MARSGTASLTTGTSTPMTTSDRPATLMYFKNSVNSANTCTITIGGETVTLEVGDQCEYGAGINGINGFTATSAGTSTLIFFPSFTK